MGAVGPRFIKPDLGEPANNSVQFPSIVTRLGSILICGSHLTILSACIILMMKSIMLAEARSSPMSLKTASARRNSLTKNKQKKYERGTIESYPLLHNEESDMKILAATPATSSWFESNDAKGFLCILGGALMHITLGTLYCWGNFQSYAPESLKFFDGKSHPGATPDSSFVMPVTLVAQCLAMPFGAKLAAKYGARATMIFGSIIVSAGVFLPPI